MRVKKTGSYHLPSSPPTHSFAPPLLSAHQAAPKAPDLVQQGSEARQQAALGRSSSRVDAGVAAGRRVAAVKRRGLPDRASDHRRCWHSREQAAARPVPLTFRGHRRLTRAPILRLATCPRRRWLPGRWRSRWSPTTVSYTHLTLPTKRIV